MPSPSLRPALLSLLALTALACSDVGGGGVDNTGGDAGPGEPAGGGGGSGTGGEVGGSGGSAGGGQGGHDGRPCQVGIDYRGRFSRGCPGLETTPCESFLDALGACVCPSVQTEVEDCMTQLAAGFLPDRCGTDEGSVADLLDGVTAGLAGRPMDGIVLYTSGDCSAVPTARPGNSGDPVWTLALGGPEDHQVNAVAPAPGGGALVAGCFVGALDLGAGPIPSAGAADAFVALLDAAGHVSWTRVFGDAADQCATAVVSVSMLKDGVPSAQIDGFPVSASPCV